MFGLRFLWFFSLPVLGAALLLGAYWLWWPLPPAFIPDNDPMPILNPGKVIAPGQLIEIQGGGFHNTDGVIVQVHAQLQDGFVIDFAPREYTTTFGRWGPVVNARFRLPCFTPPGDGYRLEITSEFPRNLLRTDVLKITTEDFSVIEGRGLCR